MNIRTPLLLGLAAGTACLAAQAVPLQEDEVDKASSAQLRAAYLECDRISATSRVDQRFMETCQRVAHVLRARDFGGDFERQLAWWRGARESARSSADGNLVREGSSQESPLE